MKHLFVTVVLTIVTTNAAHAFDTYDASTNTLSIPVVSVGGTFYKNVQVSVGAVKSVEGVVTPALAPLQDALRLVYSTPQQSSYTYAGVMDGKAVSGTTLTTISSLSNTSFEGKKGFVVTRTRKNIDASGIELSNTTTQIFMDTNYMTIGEIDQYYRVVTQSATVSNVLVQTEKIYDNATKQNLYAVNTDSVFGKVDPVDPSKIWIYESGEGKDVSGTLTNTWTSIYSVNITTGIISQEFYSSSGKSSTAIYFTRQHP